MKQTDRKFGYIFAIVFLVILLGISIYLGISGWYFATSFSQEGDMVLGNSVDLLVNKNGASSTSFSLSGGFLEGEKLAQTINVKNADGESEVYLRAKVYIFMSDSATASMSLVTGENWTYNADDGYYYYNEKLIPQGKINLATDVIIGQGSNLRSDKKYILTVLVESLDSEKDRQEHWCYSQI